MEKSNIWILLLVLVMAVLLTYTVFTLNRVIGELERSIKCNPICFPGSFDTADPNCPCNQGE